MERNATARFWHDADAHSHYSRRVLTRLAVGFVGRTTAMPFLGFFQLLREQQKLRWARHSGSTLSNGYKGQAKVVVATAAARGDTDRPRPGASGFFRTLVIITEGGFG
ncbi:hypothetical protein HRbin36_00177 [bacterium HR36]|nr:hypothetical protein HRbin36_00177 [bacterium HR36]